MNDLQRKLLNALPVEGAISTGDLGRFLDLELTTSSRHVRSLLHEEMIISWRIGRHDYLSLTDLSRVARQAGTRIEQAPASDIAGSLGHGSDILRIVAAKPGIKASDIQSELETAYPGQKDFSVMRQAEALQTRHLLARVGKIPRRSVTWREEFWLTNKGKTVLSWIEAGRREEDRLDEVLARAA